jgi:hypothetical protein
VPRYLFSAVIVCIAAACGSGESGITQPSPQAVLVHNTLNAPDNPASRNLVPSIERPPSPVGFPFALPRAFDDFTSAVTTAIRTVSWQGGYCSGGPTPPPGTSPQPPATAAASSFQLGFYRDNNSGYPNWPSTALYEVTFTPADVHERFTFDSGSTANGCSWESPNATYYDYTAVLPTPFPVTAGTRYWLLVLADTRNTGIGWGWRVGRQDNNHSANMVQSLQIGPFDLAFSLSDQ